MSDAPFRSDALARLPHGRDFRFIDEVTELIPGQSATATYTIRGDEPFLAAHFPDRPMLPGVVLIEAIAQLGGVVAQCDPNHQELDDLRLAAVRQAKINGTAVPHDTISIDAKIDGRMGPLIQVSGKVTRGNDVIAVAQVTLSGTATSNE
jgi:3-hydroxyacyl-[acyl-carrier-protein] dehydratase